MTNAQLMLLTASFPFGSGEEFIEDELPYLAQRFHRLTIAPLSVAGTARSVPAHVRVERGLAGYLAAPSLPSLPAAAARAIAKDVWDEWPVSLHPRALVRAVRCAQRALKVERWLARRLERASPTLCYAYWLGSAALGACWLRAARPALRVVARGHGVDLYRERHAPEYIPLQRALLRSLDRVYAISQHGLEYMTRLMPEGRERFRLSRLGAPQPRAQGRPSSDGTLRIVSCSNMAPIKRLERIVSGLRALSERAPRQRIHWCHLGGGPGYDAFVKTASAELAGRVQCDLPGHAPHRSIAEYYASHAVDGFINVSASEGLPVSIMEAQSFGTPVIATSVGGIPELLNERNGWLLPANPTDAQIAAALLELGRSSAEAIASKRVEARASWCTLVNAEQNYTRFARDLERLVE